MANIYKRLTFPFIFFSIAAAIGILVRYSFYFTINGFNYLNYVQAHSHIAFLGWGFLGVIFLLNKVYLTEKQQNKPIYNIIFILIIVNIFGMIFSFSLQGYKFISITLLTIFGLLSYIYCYILLKDLKTTNKGLSTLKFIKTAIYFYILSSLGIWLVGPALINYGKNYIFYDTIYFYLHFLYNGFFVFSLFGLLFQILLNKGVKFSQKALTKFYMLTIISCLPAYALSLIWHSENTIIITIGIIAAIIQLASLIYLYKLVKNIFNYKANKGISSVIFIIMIVSYFLKIIAQFFSAFPVIMHKIIELKMFFVIGYIHLFTLGFMSLLIIYLYNTLKIVLLKNKFSKFSILLLLVGILSSEIWMFLSGFLTLFKIKLPINFDLGILIFTVPLFLGVLFLLISYNTQKILAHK